MHDLPFDYLNTLAHQTILINALLGGFSLTVLVLLFEDKSSTKLMFHIFRLATISTAFFLVSIFAMTNILMLTTKGYPMPVESDELILSRLIGTVSFLLGIISVLALVALSGWTKSNSLGRFTTAVASIALILILMMTS